MPGTIRAQIVEESGIHDSVLDSTHGFSRTIRRLYFPMADLSVMLDGGSLVVLPLRATQRTFRVVGEVTVPQDLLRRKRELWILQKSVTTDMAGIALGEPSRSKDRHDGAAEIG